MIPKRLTDITIDWLNDELHDNGFRKNACIVTLKQELVGVGAGNLSEMARLTVSYDRDD